MSTTPRTPEQSDTAYRDQRIPEYIDAIVRMSGGEYAIGDIPLQPADEVSQLGTALVRLSHHIETQYRQIDAISSITTHINSGLLLDDILEHVYDHFRELIPYNRIGFALIEEDAQLGQVVRARWAKSDSAMVQLTKGYAAPLRGSTLETIIKTGQPRIINDLAQYGVYKPASESTQLILEEGIQSSLTCPLIANGVPVGFIFFSSNQLGAYADAHIDVFQRIASQLSVILEKGRLVSDIIEQRAEINRQNDELRRLNDLKNTFLGIAAHDLRNPLGNIQMAIELLMMEDVGLPEEGKQQILGDIRQQARYMTNLLSDLLDVAQIESGQLKLQPIAVDVGSFLAEVVENHNRLAATKSTTISLEAVPDGTVKADIVRIRQVIDNLISNAVKYSPPGSQVYVSARFDNSNWTIIVKDQGPGITAEDRKKLFQDFSRLSARPTNGEKSTGLGLSITRRIVEAHGGAIGVDSEPGEGAAFWFMLPGTG